MPKDLVKYLTKHLAYEVDMLNRTYGLLTRWQVVGKTAAELRDAQTVHDALIESFCIHARELFEFMRHESKRHEYTVDTYKPCGHESKYRDKLNGQIAHAKDEGRTDNDAEKIGPRDRLDMLKDLAEEWNRFLAMRAPTFKRHTVTNVAPALLVLSFSGGTTTNAATTGVEFANLKARESSEKTG
jgi:hypothetical protein